MRDIDPQDIADGNLTYAEAEYLRVRGRLPADYDMPDNDEEEADDEPVPTRVTPLEEQTQLEMEESDDEDEDDEGAPTKYTPLEDQDELEMDEPDEDPEPVPSKHTPLEEQSQLVMGNRGGIVDDDDAESETYSTEDGWTNDKRRAELSKRGLVVSGGKEELISRLRRSDADMLDDDDVAEA